MIVITPSLRIALAVAAPLGVMVGVRHTVERWWAAHLKRESLHNVSFAAWVALFVGQGLGAISLGGIATLALNAAGGGLLVLPTHGLGWWAGLAAYFIAMDLGEYLFHRAQHAVPALWAMHSLHHSDRAFDSTTAVRHYWLEPAIKTVTIWLAVGLLLKTPPSVVAVYMAVAYWHFIVHSNCRLDFGRWSWVLNAPGYHRIHHSRAQEHFDVNFASLFPIFDVLTGSYRPLRPGERVMTGLDTGEEPMDAMDVAFWPLRQARQVPVPAAST